MDFGEVSVIGPGPSRGSVVDAKVHHPDLPRTETLPTSAAWECCLLKAQRCAFLQAFPTTKEHQYVQVHTFCAGEAQYSLKV